VITQATLSYCFTAAVGHPTTGQHPSSDRLLWSNAQPTHNTGTCLSTFTLLHVNMDSDTALHACDTGQACPRHSLLSQQAVPAAACGPYYTPVSRPQQGTVKSLQCCIQFHQLKTITSSAEVGQHSPHSEPIVGNHERRDPKERHNQANNEGSLLPHANMQGHVIGQ
jgi:hypothetical protein